MAAHMGSQSGFSADSLAGLLTIDDFNERVQSLMSSVEHGEETLSFVYFNIENMKTYNDRFGFAGGDELLTFVAKTIGESFPHAIVSWFGDDRFVLATYGDDIIKGIERTHDLVFTFNPEVPTIIRAGVYVYDDPTIELNTAFNRAKLACDHIRGRYNTYYQYFDTEMLDERTRRQFVLDHINEAFETGQFQVYYQPIMRSISTKVCGYEALARWISPEAGFVSPGDFIPIMEDFRLVHRLDLHILEQVCQDYRMLESRGVTIVPVNVNLSPYDMELCDIADEVYEIIQRYDVPPEMVNIELTESTFAKDNELLSQTIDRFHELGMQVWMDDFGSGYSSLNVLREYDFDVVKLDMEFLRYKNEESYARSRSMLPHIISMCKELKLQTLIEGVEEMEQFEFLKNDGCEKVQGFAFGKPTPIEYVLKQLVEGTHDVETAPMRAYLDKVGNVNLAHPLSISKDMSREFEMSAGFPAAIVEFDKGHVHYLLWNDSYVEYLIDIGMNTIENSERKMNDLSRPQSQGFFATAKKFRGSDEWASLAFYEGEDLCTGMARCISVDEVNDTAAYVYLAYNLGKYLSRAGFSVPREAIKPVSAS